MLAKLKRLNHRHVLPDIVIITFSLYTSLFLRLGWIEFTEYLPLINKHLALFIVLRVGTLLALGAYDIIWRYVSIKDALHLVKAVLLSSLVIIAASYLVDIGRLPRATFVIDAVLASILLGAVRLARRIIFEKSANRLLDAHGRRTLIYGAGSNGRTIAQRFSSDGALGYKIIGFIDDDPQKVGRFIAGERVLGTRKQLNEIIDAYQVQEILIAITRPSGELLRDVVQICRPHQFMPRLVSGRHRVSEKGKNVEVLRNVELSDLLNRPRRNLDFNSVRSLVQNRKVLVTGAGGSIGSEIARQIFDFGPSSLLLMDHSEYNLYQIDKELRTSQGDSSLVVPLLVDIRDKTTLSHIFQEYLPEIVFHAAAYKHVHLVEKNPYPSILNNVMGTKNLLELSEACAVNTFVLISSDKAVNPAGIMGSTKRVCELLVSEVGQRTGKRYCSVRFGNVLGSSGSLIPLLKQQIENGEPITITHKDMTRYFMLIPEAVSLVLKAAAIAKAGGISLLKMGEPVKIVDIAKSLIALLGKKEEEVPIVFTGLRPGEKLFEELYICGNELKTEDPDILMLPDGDKGISPNFSPGYPREEVSSIIRLAKSGDKESIFQINRLVQSNYIAPEPADENPELPITRPPKRTLSLFRKPRRPLDGTPPP